MDTVNNSLLSDCLWIKFTHSFIISFFQRSPCEYERKTTVENEILSHLFCLKCAELNVNQRSLHSIVAIENKPTTFTNDILRICGKSTEIQRRETYTIICHSY